MPRETESNLQTWDSNPNSSESRNWPKEDIEQSIDLRVDGITNDETYKDEQCMQRIAEQVQKLVITKELIKDDSPKDTIIVRICTQRSSTGICGSHTIGNGTSR